MTGLRECPWCGHQPVRAPDLNGGLFKWMVCSNEDCCAEGPISKDDPEGAWNHRPEQVAVTAEEVADIIGEYWDAGSGWRNKAATAVLALLREKGLTR